MNTNELTFLFTFVDGFYQALFHTLFDKKLGYLWENERCLKKKLTFTVFSVLRAASLLPVTS